MSDVRTFGPFAFDPRTLELRRGEERIPLEPKPARVLARLLERAGELVTREELLELGWPRLPHVADASLNTCLRQIRDALGDDPRAPRFVETLRGRGYRFVARVDAPTAAGVPAVPSGSARPFPPPHRGTLRWAALAAAAGGLLALATADARRDFVPPAVHAELTKARLVHERYQDPQKALELVDALLPEHEGVPAVQTLRSELLLFLGRHTEAARAAETGLSLDPDDATGLRTRSSLAMFAGRWDEAEAALGRSLEGGPDEALTWVARAYLSTVRGRFDEADAAIRRALELDALSPTVQGDVGLLHLWAGRYDDAVASCREVISLSDELPAWAIECAFDALTLAGRTGEAVAWGGPLMVDARLVPADVLPAGRGRPGAGTVRGNASSDAARALRAARLSVLRSRQAGGEPVSPYLLALACARTGDVDGALEALERPSREPGFGVLSAGVDPRFGALRTDARFLALLSRFGLEVVG
jgi:DNA-binding winged helix-turn-helix (wHTH) protein/Flp pilus assembly protein TadD